MGRAKYNGNGGKQGHPGAWHPGLLVREIYQVPCSAASPGALFRGRLVSLLSIPFGRSNAVIAEQSVVKRMHNINVRMRLEKISGIAVTAKDAFLVYCQEQESADLAIIDVS